MVKSVKCPICGYFYNGSSYQKCPYCSKQKEKDKSKKWHCIWRKEKEVNSISKEESEPRDIQEELPVQPKPEEITLPQNISDPMPETGPYQYLDNKSLEKEKETFDAESSPDDDANDEAEKSMPLSKQIERMQKTVGTYISKNGGETVQPVVGWLVGIKGAYLGESFPLKKGRNRIGRSYKMDIELVDDDSIPRACAAEIVYDVKSGEFSLLCGESDSLCYLNGKALYERQILKGYENIEFGDEGLNCFKFVPFCGERFDYSEYKAEEEKK